MQGAGQVFVRHRLGQKQQGMKALFQITVKKAGTRAKAGVTRHQPEMGNPAGGMPLCDQIADQQIVSFAAALGGQNIPRFAVAGKGIARAHHGYAVPGLAQPIRTGSRQPFGIGKDQPALHRRICQIGSQIKPCCRLPPLRLPAPVCHIGNTVWHGCRISNPGNSRFDEIGFALKRIGRQRHPLAARTAPDRGPIHRHAASPQPRNRC